MCHVFIWCPQFTVSQSSCCAWLLCCCAVQTDVPLMNPGICLGSVCHCVCTALLHNSTVMLSLTSPTHSGILPALLYCQHQHIFSLLQTWQCATGQSQQCILSATTGVLSTAVSLQTAAPCPCCILSSMHPLMLLTPAALLFTECRDLCVVFCLIKACHTLCVAKQTSAWPGNTQS